jgi:hypothetical protein
MSISPLDLRELFPPCENMSPQQRVAFSAQKTANCLRLLGLLGLLQPHWLRQIAEIRNRMHEFSADKAHPAMGGCDCLEGLNFPP